MASAVQYDFFKGLDEVIARLSRAAFLVFWVVLFLRVADFLDLQNGRALSGFSGWAADWKIQLIYLATIGSSGGAFVLAIVQMMGAVSAEMNSLRVGRAHRVFYVVDAIIIVVICSMFVLFLSFALASLGISDLALIVG